MKLGILTYHRSVNYGAFMQAYALSRRLNELAGVEAEIIDYMSMRMDRYYKLFTVYRGRNGLLRIGDRLAMYRAFSRSVKRLPLSEQKLVTDDAQRFFRYVKGKYDAIVVGSDAVWNYEQRGLPNPYFLMDDVGARKLSYAASCNGIQYDQLDDKKLDVLKRAFEGFEYIGVRDELTETVVARALGRQAARHNCDPTFLLDFEKDGLGDEFVAALVGKLQKKYGWDAGKKHIGLMLSNLNGNLAGRLVAGLKERYGDEYQIVSLYSYCGCADIPYIADLTPFEWSRIFSLFDLTFSKYFHGTLLSILNGTPVISLSAEKHIKGIAAKVEDVLGRLDLMEFYCPAGRESEIDLRTLMEKTDALISCPPVEKMSKAVEKERESAGSFFAHIQSMTAERGE